MPRQRDQQLLRTIGARVGQIRRERGWTQEALAEALRIEPVTLSRLETGDRAMSLSVLNAAADVLGVSLGDLLDAVRPKPVPQADLGEEELIRLWRTSDAPARKTILRVVRALCAKDGVTES